MSLCQKYAEMKKTLCNDERPFWLIVIFSEL